MNPIVRGLVTHIDLLTFISQNERTSNGVGPVQNGYHSNGIGTNGST